MEFETIIKDMCTAFETACTENKLLFAFHPALYAKMAYDVSWKTHRDLLAINHPQAEAFRLVAEIYKTNARNSTGSELVKWGKSSQ